MPSRRRRSQRSRSRRSRRRRSRTARWPTVRRRKRNHRGRTRSSSMARLCWASLTRWRSSKRSWGSHRRHNRRRRTHHHYSSSDGTSSSISSRKPYYFRRRRSRFRGRGHSGSRRRRYASLLRYVMSTSWTEDFEDDFEHSTGGVTADHTERIVKGRSILNSEPPYNSKENTNMRGDVNSGGYRAVEQNLSSGSGAFMSAAGLNYARSNLLDEIIVEEADEEAAKCTPSIYVLSTLNTNYDFISRNKSRKAAEKGLNSADIHFQIGEADDTISQANPFTANPIVATSVEDFDTAKGVISHSQARMPVESSYISIPNMHNYISAHPGQGSQYKIRQPLVEKYVIETAKPGTEQTECGIATAQQEVKQAQYQDDFTTESETETALNFSITEKNSEYAFNVDNYGNISEQLAIVAENYKVGKKPGIKDMQEAEEEVRESYPAEVDTEVGKLKADIPQKKYIESYYNINEMRHWNLY